MNTTIGIFATHATAEKGLTELRDNHIDENDLSYLYKDEAGDVKDGQSGSKVATGTTIGATTGIVGATAVAGVGAGAVTGGLIGALTRMGG